MKKINYRLVYNRKKSLNNEGKALVQVEAYLESKKIYFSTHTSIFTRNNGTPDMQLSSNIRRRKN